MQNLGIWGVSYLREFAKDFQYGVFPLPLPPNGQQRNIFGGWAFVANAKGKNPEEAAKFCVWAVGSMEDDCIQRVVDWCTKANSNLLPRKSALEKATTEGAYSTAPMKLFKNVIFPTGKDQLRAMTLNALANLYSQTEAYAKAEPILKQALDTQNRIFGPDSPATAVSVSNLAVLYLYLEDFAKAEPLCQKALDIWQKSLGADHPVTALALTNLAAAYDGMREYAKAEQLLQQALRMDLLPDGCKCLFRIYLTCHVRGVSR